MLTYLEGDIFKSKMQTLVIPVNTVGRMGKGLAKAFAERYPDVVEPYQRACRASVFSREGFFLHEEYRKDEIRFLLCFPTKMHWRYASRIDWITEGLFKLTMKWNDYGIESIAFPALGCGEGQLLWDDVKPVMDLYLRRLPIPVEIYQPTQQRHSMFSDFAL